VWADSDPRIALSRHFDFAKKVRTIVIECSNERQTANKGFKVLSDMPGSDAKRGASPMRRPRLTSRCSRRRGVEIGHAPRLSRGASGGVQA
jgi:hypothetical protein